MEGNVKELIKNIGIAFLAIVAIILLVIVISYNKISIGRVIPRVETYELSDEIKQEIDNANSDENSEIVTTYEIDASDLKQYEKTKEYNKGKKDPFAAESSQPDNNENVILDGDSSSDNFYEDDGTK